MVLREESRLAVDPDLGAYCLAKEGALARDVAEGKADNAPAPKAVLDGTGARPAAPPPRWPSNVPAPRSPRPIVNSNAYFISCTPPPSSD